MCIAIMAILFRIAIRYITSIFDKVSPQDTIMAGYYHFTFLFYYENQYRSVLASLKKKLFRQCLSPFDFQAPWKIVTQLEMFNCMITV